MDRVRDIFSSQQHEDEESIISDSGQLFPSLSYATRIKGFVICFVIGILLSILVYAIVLLFIFKSTLFLFLPGRGTILFGLFYSIGNLCALTSTFFLMGPVNQCKRMFAQSRIVAAVFVLVFLSLTIISAVYHKTAVCLIFSVLQAISLTWYSISFIPYAREAVRSCLTCI